MDELVRWLNAQLDEDERIARATGERFGFAWAADGDMVSSEIDYVSVVEEPGSPTEYIAEHDPARVLREIDAKRQVLATIVPRMNEMDDQIHSEWGVGPMDPATYESLALLRLLALPYCDRPGYRSEWAPTR